MNRRRTVPASSPDRGSAGCHRRPREHEVVVAGDLPGYLALHEELDQHAPRSGGEDLLGMQVDLEHYLGPDGPLEREHLVVSASRTDDPVRGWVSLEGCWSAPAAEGAVRDVRGASRARALDLSRLWVAELAYRHAQAHVVTVSWGGAVVLRGVTQIEPGGLYAGVIISTHA